MFITTHRFNPFEDFERSFDSLWVDDFFSSFSKLSQPKKWKQSKEERLKKNLSKLHSQENEINHYIKQYESHIEQLKKNREHIEKQKTDISDKIAKIEEEKKKILKENPQSNSKSNTSTDSFVFKKVHYKTDDMEIEEQYDSSNPKNCFKIIKKQGEAPQIIKGEEQNQQIESKPKPEEEEVEVVHSEKLGDGLDEKYESLSKMIGKNTQELKNLVLENKDLSIGQLFDKAAELKLI